MNQCDPSSEGLADLLEAHRGDIVRRWQERARKSLSPQSLYLIGALPEFLDAVVAALRGKPAPGATPLSLADTLADAHGAQHFSAGLGLSAVVSEYTMLREVILELLREGARPLEPEPLRRLMDALATAGAEALRRYAVEHIEREREEARGRMRRFLASLPIIYWSFDARGVLSICEGQGLRRVGFEPAMLVGRSVFEVFADHPPILEAIQRSLRGEAFSVQLEFRGVGFEVGFLPERGADGAVESVSGLALDITERLHAEAELRESETRYRLATLATSDAIWDWDIGSGQVHWSENIYRLTGLALGKVELGIDWWAGRIHPEDRERVVRGLYAVVDGAEAHWMDEYRFQRADSSYMFVNDRGYVVRDTQGRAVRMVGALQDVTEHKLAEQETRRRADFEQHLIGIVSHDLRNPLNAISMAATMLVTRGGLDEPQRRSLHRILSSTQRATRMLSDLLDFTQARLGGGIPVKPRPLDLHELTRQVVEEVQLAYPHQPIILEQGGDGRGEWDSDRLAQLITNLVNNALTHGQKHGTVRVRTLGQPDALLLSVHNTGEPIPAELMSQLFQPLQRGEGKGPQGSHSIGLGLFIVKHIVDAHGGSIRVDSSTENGTTFTVCLPRHPPQAPRPPRS